MNVIRGVAFRAKTILHLTVGAIALSAAVACSASAPSPDVAAKEVMQAIASQDVVKVGEVTCAANQQGVQGGLAGLAGMAPGSSGTKINVDDLKYSTDSNDGTKASVHVTGPMRITVGSTSQSSPVDISLPLKYENGKWRICTG
jgi:hypothetical protein